jgi:hypothetical protein
MQEMGPIPAPAGIAMTLAAVTIALLDGRGASTAH